MSPVIEKTNNLIDRLHTSQILVGLDVGFKTIGIAVSDRSYTIATPLNTVLRKGTAKDLIKLKEYLIEYEIGGFVVGLPISLDGSENEQTKKILNFSSELQTFFSLPVEYWDERYSSDVIFKEMRNSDISTTKIKKKLDQQSAAYILQGYLDRYRNKI
tara:strand:- start:775 stop:1248 length:474 start_codon:yes stop_codon:yes gene_type:complete